MLKARSGRYPAMHHGKFRATVRDNRDPLQLGRLQVDIEDVLVPAAWALPCLPPGGIAVLPDVGDGVWVEFERGDLGRPIWCGVFWTDPARVPASLRAPDGPGIRVGAHGIAIASSAGALIELSGPTVTINGGALVVT